MYGELSELNWLQGPDDASVTTTSQTLAEMGVTLDRSLRVLRVSIPDTAVVSFNYDGAAVDGTHPLDSGVHMFPIDAGKAARLQFICDSGTVNIDVVQHGPAEHERE